MADLWLEWKNDFEQTASGDLQLADGDDMTRQRIERRLFTAVRGYIWHQDYGAGLQQKIGTTALAANIQSLCRAQIALEQSVATTPIPVIKVWESKTNLGLFVISITYTDAATGQSVDLQFEVPSS